jgi:opacity protein-like surface antigen
MKRGFRLQQFIVMLIAFGAWLYWSEPEARAADSFLASQAGVQFAAVMPHDSSGSGISDHANKAGGIAATYTFHIDKWMAAGFDYGQTRFTNNFSGSFGSASVQSNVRQVELDFLVHIPDGLKRVHAFGVAGVGLFHFSPTDNVNNFAGVSSRTRNAGVFGAGADIDVSKRFGIRADYRIARYKVPDFNLASLDLKQDAHFAQPSIGVFYRFGGFALGKD